MAVIVKATTPEHFAQFQELVDELMAWDRAMSEQIGLDVQAMLGFLYDAKAPPGEVFLVFGDGGLAGCGALKHLSSDVAELSRVYVRPAYRGRGVAKTILDAILTRAGEAGYEKVCLQTATFMTSAHALYRSFGFQLTEPYRELPEALKDADLFMELRLEKAI